MALVLNSITVILALLMFFLKREHKLMLLWFSILCMDVFPQIKTVGVVLNIPTFFLLSEYKTILNFIGKYNKTWFKSVLIVVSLSMVVLFFASPHYIEKGFVGAISIMEYELIRKYFFVLYTISCVTGKQTVKSLFEVTKLGVILLTIWGGLNLLLGHPIYLELMLSGIDDMTGSQLKALSDVVGMSERMRVRSMFLYPFDYGYICLISLLFTLYCKNLRLATEKQCWFIMACSLFGIIVCACRTVYICFAISFACYLGLVYNQKRRMSYVLIILIVGLISYEFIPKVQDTVNLAVSAFDENSTVEGSTIEKRQASYMAAYYYAKDDLILGRGKDFYLEDLGAKESERFDADIHGLEGAYMILLLERGLFGLGIYLFFYIFLLAYVYKMREVDKVAAGSCVSVLIAYILFANITGELGSVAPTLFLVGVFLKIIYLNDKLYVNSRKIRT